MMLWSLLAHIPASPPPTEPTPPAEPGWQELGACAETTSLDASHTLELSADGGATLTERHSQIEGRWTFEAGAYQVAFPRSRETYRRVMAGGGICMLVVGPPGAVDLRISFFGQ
jgi:hypothetical protein